MAANPIIESFLANQGYALFEYADNGVFRPIGDYPKWCEKIWSGAVARDKTIRLGGSLAIHRELSDRCRGILEFTARWLGQFSCVD